MLENNVHHWNIRILMLFSHFQSQINDAGTGELKVAVNTCQSEDPAKVVTENNPTAVKGALDDIDEKLM